MLTMHFTAIFRGYAVPAWRLSCARSGSGHNRIRSRSESLSKRRPASVSGDAAGATCLSSSLIPG